MGRRAHAAQQSSQVNPLKIEASGDFFRRWLEGVLKTNPDTISLFGNIREESGKVSSAIVRYLVECTNIEDKQIRGYLGVKEASPVNAISIGNPRLDNAMTIAQAMRAKSPYAHPLCMLYTVPEFKPHAWGVIGKLCAPGPTQDVLAIWPAIRWVIAPNCTSQDVAFDIFGDAAFNAKFDKAWSDWSKSKNSSSFPEPLMGAIDHARTAPIQSLQLHDQSIAHWAEMVANTPARFGRRMKMLENRVLSARNAYYDVICALLFNVPIDQGSISNLCLYRPYLSQLLQSEECSLRNSVRRLLLMHNKLSDFADLV